MKMLRQMEKQIARFALKRWGRRDGRQLQRPFRVLAVDDEKAATQLAKTMLEVIPSFVVETANRASLVMAHVQRFKPDLILMDLKMPEVNGQKLADDLTKIPEYSHIPIIFLTAQFTRDELAATGNQIGGRWYFAKPLNTAELLECISFLRMGNRREVDLVKWRSFARWHRLRQ